MVGTLIATYYEGGSNVKEWKGLWIFLKLFKLTILTFFPVRV